MNQVDTLLPALYEQFNVPADQLVINSLLADRFVDLVRERASNKSLAKVEVLGRLITLRKRGLLPRIRR
jgi:hypothetical protein